MFFRLKRAMNMARFDSRCRGILKTHPMICNDESFTVVSMTCHRELTMYLLAVKSFCHYLGSVPKIVLLSDGSLTEEDRAVIVSHIPHIKFLHIRDVPKGRVPKGGSWESFLLVCDLAQDSYVVQIDSDTLTRGPIPEVRACIDENRSFTILGDRSWPEIEPMAEASKRAKSNPSDMVQAVVERTMDQLPEASSLNYVRGNAGFIGFPKGSITRERTEWFSDLMRGLVGNKWDEWGSEQVTTNLLIANIEGARPLPSLRYAGYWAHSDVPYDEASFLHFIGPCRFAHNYYIRKGREVIGALPGGTKE